MKKIALICAVLSLSACVASAETITVGSYATGASNLGNQNLPVNFDGSVAQPSGPYSSNPSAFITSGTNSTFTLGTGGIWTSPLANSTYVSNNAQSGPGGSDVEPNGYYTYDTSFAAIGGTYSGMLSLLADDTVAVYLNNVLLVPAGMIGGDSKCSDNVPNCITVDTVPFTTNLLAGTNKLTFVVEQTGLVSEGFDFSGSFSTTVTPEPSSLIMLSTGLLSAGGMLVRRRRIA